MAWYDEAVFYHIYPLGLTGAPKKNPGGEPVNRLAELTPWITHLRRLGITGLYIGPLFESEGHGYETTDYKKVDTRLGTNADLKKLVDVCHENGIRVILDGVFNHTGRTFFAFQDLLKNRENSAYRDWYCNVNFYGNNEYNDGFSYANWGGFNLLVKLNQRNPAVRDYICDVIRFWADEFGIDGLRLDAADVLDFEFMKALRRTANEIGNDFWLMGEVIHGDYSRWVNPETLHSVTNYALHKALYSGHNDQNYFEIAHTVKRTFDMIPQSVHLYNFVDNHDVERIYTKLRNKANFVPVHILLYTLPGIPSIYYGSEFGIEGKKERYSDDSLRPAISLDDHLSDYEENPCTKLICALGSIYREHRDLAYGNYRELSLTTKQFAYARGDMIVAVNNDPGAAEIGVRVPDGTYVGLLDGKKVQAKDGYMVLKIQGCSGNIYAPEGDAKDPVSIILEEAPEVPETTEVKTAAAPKAEEEKAEAKAEALTKADAKQKEEPKESEKESVQIPDIPYEEMTVAQLQAVILRKLSERGPVTDRMERDVEENIWRDSLINWVKSFR